MRRRTPSTRISRRPASRTPAGHDAQLGRGRPEPDGRTVPRGAMDGAAQRGRVGPRAPAARPAEAPVGVVAQPRGGRGPGAARATGYRRHPPCAPGSVVGRGERAASCRPSPPPAAVTDVQAPSPDAPLRLAPTPGRRAAPRVVSVARHRHAARRPPCRPTARAGTGADELHDGPLQPAAVRGVPVVREIARRVGVGVEVVVVAAVELAVQPAVRAEHRHRDALGVRVAHDVVLVGAVGEGARCARPYVECGAVFWTAPSVCISSCDSAQPQQPVSTRA